MKRNCFPLYNDPITTLSITKETSKKTYYSVGLNYRILLLIHRVLKHPTVNPDLNQSFRPRPNRVDTQTLVDGLADPRSTKPPGATCVDRLETGCREEEEIRSSPNKCVAPTRPEVLSSTFVRCVNSGSAP